MHAMALDIDCPRAFHPPVVPREACVSSGIGHAVHDLAGLMLASALGGLARYWLSGVVGRRIGERFPWGTMTVNVTGAFAIGVAAALASAGRGWLADPGMAQITMIGFLGSYTTVSAFSLQTLALARDGELRHATANVVLSVGLCLSAAALGLAAGGLLAGVG
jgi:fluoride exporter